MGVLSAGRRHQTHTWKGLYQQNACSLAARKSQQSRDFHDEEEFMYYDVGANDPNVLPRREKVVKKKKPKKKVEKILPPVPTLEEYREQMNQRFVAIEKEKFGPNRGVGAVKFLAGKKCEQMHKVVTTKLANTILNDWIYSRHALRHGHRHINHMNKVQLAESLIRPGTFIKFEPAIARKCLKEIFRYGKSAMLQTYHDRDRERDKSIKSDEEIQFRNDGRKKTLEILGYLEKAIIVEVKRHTEVTENRRSMYPRPTDPAFCANATTVTNDDSHEGEEFAADGSGSGIPVAKQESEGNEDFKH